MKLLINGAGSYLTGDDIADAVMRYGVALANECKVDIVEMPYVGSTGAIDNVQLTVGWRVSMAAEHAETAEAELVDGEVAADLRTRTEALRARGDRPVPLDEVSYLAEGDDL